MTPAFALAPMARRVRARGGARGVCMSARFGVVITGSTRGVGRALARRFVASNDAVVVSSRSRDDVHHCVQRLRTHAQHASVFGCVADVRDEQQVMHLGQFARQNVGVVDAVICNAGTVGKRAPLEHADADDLRRVVDTNLMGSLLCAREAVRIGEAQQRRVHVFLVDGSGTIGNATATYAAYGATKRSIPQLVKTLNKENAHGFCRFHCVSPGMVLTELLLAENVEPSSRRIFNFLAEEPHTVADYVVPRIRAVLQEDARNTYIRYLRFGKAAYQLLTGFALGFRKNKFFDERSGERVRRAGERYSASGVRESE